MYSVKIKGTGFYSVPDKIRPEDSERIADHANIRSTLQIYPEVRRLALGLVSAAGYNLKLPIEPGFEGVTQHKTKEKDGATAVEHA